MAITTRYVSSSGAGTYAGSTSSATPCSISTAQSNAAAGDWFKVIADGNYPTGALTFATSGTATSPIIWEAVAPTTFTSGFLGRGTGGPLDTTNMAVFPLASTNTLVFSGNFQIIVGFKVTGNITGYPLNISGTSCAAIGCISSNASTNTAAQGLRLGGATSMAICCDALLTSTGGATGSGLTVANSGSVFGCRVNNPNGLGLNLSAGAAMSCVANTVWGSGLDGIGVRSNTALAIIIANTVHNSVGDGIDVQSGVTTTQYILGNCCTNNGGFGINGNSATAAIILAANRLRDNTSGGVGGIADWLTAFLDVTSGAGVSDYTNAAGFDFSLISSSPAVQKALAYWLPIGGNGLAVPVTPGFVIGG